jgi:integrase
MEEHVTTAHGAVSEAAPKIGKLNEAAIKNLPKPPSGNRVYWFGGEKLQGKTAPSGFGVRVTAGGSRAFVLDYRVNGTKRRFTIGEHGAWSVIAAVEEAQKLRRAVDKGTDPQTEKDRARSAEPFGKTVGTVLDDFIARYVRPKLRGAVAIESAFNKHVRPAIGKIVVYDLTRRHLAEMLDHVEDKAGPVMADRTRAYFRKALVWWSERDEEFLFSKVFVKVAPRSTSESRDRVLSDDEIRAIWPALTGTFGALVKVLLLTGQRRGEVAGMRRSEIGEDDGIWEIPAARMKGKKPHAVPLTPAVTAIIAAQPAGDLVFPSSANTPFTAFGDAKADLDKRAPIAPWRVHDLRRTARSLMSRAGVDSDIAERVIGHALTGVRRTYDRHDYAAQKKAALERLAALIDLIVNPPADNVVNLGEKAKKKAKRAQAAST